MVGFRRDFAHPGGLSPWPPRSRPASGYSRTVRLWLYIRNCFVLEARHPCQIGTPKQLTQYLPGMEAPTRGVHDFSRARGVLMLVARDEAEGYARALPTDHGWPPFILVCDIGRAIETYADFFHQGKNYAQFPDGQSFHIYLEYLRSPEKRERPDQIWTAPRTSTPHAIPLG